MNASRGSSWLALGGILNRAVLIGALGYFVDIYDLLLYSIVRVQSLRDIGVPQEDILETGVYILNWQMAGLLLGGILWGVLGDKKGRLSVLFGSIFLYSAANVANAYVTDVSSYAALRFAAGVGLAGELGAAVTLVSEVMPKETRGYGTAIVAGVGILGAVAAGFVGRVADWRTAYLIGGVLGLVLILARLSLVESGLFRAAARSNVPRGNLLLLFASPQRAARYAYCVLIGLPLWFVIGILITFSPELARDLRVTGPVAAGTAVMVSYTGLSLGDLASGFLSQWFRTRWWVVFYFILFTAAGIFTYYFARGIDPVAFYAICFALGVFAGYWAVFVTIAGEQFGTNLRSTVATTVPNLIRGSVVPITLAFKWLAEDLGLARSALVVGTACLLIALYALRKLEETYGKDLDFLEGDPRDRPTPLPTPFSTPRPSPPEP